MITFFLLAMTLLSAQADLPIATQPFEPAYAADQTRVDFESLSHELNQFRYFSSWSVQQTELQNKKEERDSLKKTFDRLRDMSKSTVTAEKIELARYLWQMSEIEIEQITKRVDNARASAETEKLLIVQTGNPREDYTLFIAEKLKRSLEFEGELLGLSLKSAQATRELYKLRDDRARALCSKGIQPPVYCEDMQREHQASMRREVSVQAQIENNSRSRDGLRRSIERLKAAAPGPT